jgi:hypothetical protein
MPAGFVWSGWQDQICYAARRLAGAAVLLAEEYLATAARAEGRVRREASKSAVLRIFLDMIALLHAHAPAQEEPDFRPPELPLMMSGEQLLMYIPSLYPDVQLPDPQLLELSHAMDNYNRGRRAYEGLSAVFGEWLQWYKQYPKEKETLVAFLTEHHASFCSCQETLILINTAVGRWLQKWGERGNLGEIRSIVAKVDDDSSQLARHLEMMQSPGSPRRSHERNFTASKTVK